MKYAVLFYETPEEFAKRSGEGSKVYWRDWTAYFDAVYGAQVSHGGAALQAGATAEVVTFSGDQRHVQDGPFADAKEELGGFFILEAPDLDAALEWAARAPAAATGAVEVRPIVEFGDGADGDAPAPAEGEAARSSHAILIYDDERTLRLSPAEQEAEMGQWFAYTAAMREAGIIRHGEALQPAATATTVRMRGAERQVHDGPYADTKEQLGGFYLVRCPDDEARRDWAARCPAATSGGIELRPVHAMEG